MNTRKQRVIDNAITNQLTPQVQFAVMAAYGGLLYQRPDAITEGRKTAGRLSRSRNDVFDECNASVSQGEATYNPRDAH